MTLQETGGGRRGWTYAAAATAVLLVIGVLALVLGLRGQSGPPQPASAPLGANASGTSSPAPSSPSSTPTTGSGGSTTSSPAPTSTPDAAPDATPGKQMGPFIAASAPTGIEIPSIGVTSTNFVDLTVATDGTLNVPGTADEVGFYTGGPTPGQLGPAVLAAHVDSTKGPGIFYRLGAVKAGDAVKISRADGSTTTFLVDKVASYPKDQFPTEEVYRGSFDTSQIRLVTCGGTFDKVKHYLDNVVVFGHLATVA